MLEPMNLVERVTLHFNAQQQEKTLSDLTVTITAGPTREALDPVRYITNHSSGKMGFALAEAAAEAAEEAAFAGAIVEGDAMKEPPTITPVPAPEVDGEWNLNIYGHAMLDMGDFAGGMLKYLAKNPVPRLTIAGGFGKLTKLAQGAIDLHSGRSQVDFAALASCGAVPSADRPKVAASNTAQEALTTVGPALAIEIAHTARDKARALVRGAEIDIQIMIIARNGEILAETSG